VGGVEATFKPEFVNRLDDIVEFASLSRDQIAEIVAIQVDALARRVRDRGVEIELSDDALMLIANLGYDPTYGARPLKRMIQERLVDKLALRLLEGEFGPGDRVRVDAGGERRSSRRASRRQQPLSASTLADRGCLLKRHRGVLHAPGRRGSVAPPPAQIEVEVMS